MSDRSLWRFWNGRLLATPAAARALLGASWGGLTDRISTWLHAPNLAASGSGVRIGGGCVIRVPAGITLHDRVSIGRRVTLAAELREGRLEIGEGTQLDVDCTLDFTGHLVIGRDCTVSARSRIFTHDHGRDPRSQPNARSLRIGDGVWLGTGAVILQNVGEIGDGALVAAGAVVTKPVPAGAVVAGNPARIVGQDAGSATGPNQS